jgi:hypothetical protein
MAMASQVDSSLFSSLMWRFTVSSWRFFLLIRREAERGRKDVESRNERDEWSESDSLRMLHGRCYKNTSRALDNIVEKRRFLSPQDALRFNFWLSHQLCPPPTALLRKYSVCIAAAALYQQPRNNNNSNNIYHTQQKKVWFQSRRGRIMWGGKQRQSILYVQLYTRTHSICVGVLLQGKEPKETNKRSGQQQQQQQ